jgi:hypothetical protein
MHNRDVGNESDGELPPEPGFARREAHRDKNV